MTKGIPASQVVIEVFASQWKMFKEKLPEDLHPDFDQLMKYAKKHPVPGNVSRLQRVSVVSFTK